MPAGKRSELLALPIADQAKQVCNFMQRNVTATFDLGDKLTDAKDMQDALKLHSEFFQDQMRSLTDQSKAWVSRNDESGCGGFSPEELVSCYFLSSPTILRAGQGP